MSAAVPPKPRYRLLKNYYSRADYFRHDINKGTIRTPTGERICALTSDFLIGFHKAVEFECGKATGQVFKTAGKRWGKQFTERFDRDLSAHYRTPIKDMSTALVYECLAEAFRHHGWGKLSFTFSESEFGYMVVELKNSVMPELLARISKRREPVDHLMTGFFASFFSHFAGQELDCEQTECPSKGADTSRYVIGLRDRIQKVPQWLQQGLSQGELLSRLRITVL